MYDSEQAMYFENIQQNQESDYNIKTNSRQMSSKQSNRDDLRMKGQTATNYGHKMYL